MKQQINKLHQEEVKLLPGSIHQQLQSLPEPQLQQILKQANNWADYTRNTQLITEIAKDMKEIRELPSEMPKDSNALTKVEFPEKGGVLTWMERQQYPYKGFPFYEFVDKIDFVKKVSRAFLSGLYHQLKNRSKLWLLTLIPGIWLSKGAFRAGIYVFYKIIERFKVKKERYCDFLRELHRAFSLIRHGESQKEADFREVFRDTVCMILEFDNAYRFRVQDLLGELNQKAIKSNTIKELLRLLKIMSEREKTQEVKDTWKLLKYAVSFYLRFDKNLRLMIAHVLSNLDIEKVKLSIEDKSFCAPRKDYTFGFMINPDKETKKLIRTAELNDECKEARAKVLDESTKAHDNLAERHKKELEAFKSVSLNGEKEVSAELEKINQQAINEQNAIRAKYEPMFQKVYDRLMPKEQKELYSKQVQERIDLDIKFNQLLKETEEKYESQKLKL